VVQFSEPKRGTYKKLIIRDGAGGGILLGDISKAAYLIQLRPEHTAVPKNGCICCRSGRSAETGDLRRDERRHAGVQLQRSEQGRAAGLRERGQTQRKGRDGRDARRNGLRIVRIDVAEIVEWRAAEKQRKIPRFILRSGVPLTKPELIRAIRERNLKSVSAVFDYLAGGKEDAAANRVSHPS